MLSDPKFYRVDYYVPATIMKNYSKLNPDISSNLLFKLVKNNQIHSPLDEAIRNHIEKPPYKERENCSRYY